MDEYRFPKIKMLGNGYCPDGRPRLTCQCERCGRFVECREDTPPCENCYPHDHNIYSCLKTIDDIQDSIAEQKSYL